MPALRPLLPTRPIGVAYDDCAAGNRDHPETRPARRNRSMPVIVQSAPDDWTRAGPEKPAALRPQRAARDRRGFPGTGGPPSVERGALRGRLYVRRCNCPRLQKSRSVPSAAPDRWLPRCLTRARHGCRLQTHRERRRRHSGVKERRLFSDRTDIAGFVAQTDLRCQPRHGPARRRKNWDVRGRYPVVKTSPHRCRVRHPDPAVLKGLVGIGGGADQGCQGLGTRGQVERGDSWSGTVDAHDETLLVGDDLTV